VADLDKSCGVYHAIASAGRREMLRTVVQRCYRPSLESYPLCYHLLWRLPWISVVSTVFTDFDA
jgi:hypothetical protein